MVSRSIDRRRLTGGCLVLVLAGGCVGAPPGSPDSPPPGDVAPAGGATATQGGPPPGTAAPPAAPPASAPAGFALYRQSGLLAQNGDIPFVGSVRYFAGPSAESTLVLVALSLSNRSFAFTPEGNGERAAFGVTTAIRDSSAMVARVEDEQIIRVGSFKETTRGDESVVFQRFLTLHPGIYSLSVTVNDRGTSKSTSGQINITVPPLGATALSSPTSVHRATPRVRADSLPDLIANPRATLVFGRDSIASIYLEAYSLEVGSRIAITVENPDHQALLRDTVKITRTQALAAAVFDLPMTRLGLGRRWVVATIVGSPDTVRTPLWITVGEGIGIVGFDELLNYLRYFATAERLQTLRDTPPDDRAAAWAAFWKSTDPNPATVENEALTDYFERIQIANKQFAEQGEPGWLTDRGKVFITLGEPDQIMGQNGRGLTPSGRSQYWAYSHHGIRFEFVDQSGFGRWRLTQKSEADFEQVAAQERVH